MGFQSPGASLVTESVLGPFQANHLRIWIPIRGRKQTQRQQNVFNLLLLRIERL
jgi:hypothetical protein